ncbi:MAG: hypothetical protein KGJ55_01875, partial [Gammaproteobacteria bacterium]|nr:hypothetical protein [Gammaproteobacteria bacterium]
MSLAFAGDPGVPAPRTGDSAAKTQTLWLAASSGLVAVDTAAGRVRFKVSSEEPVHAVAVDRVQRRVWVQIGTDRLAAYDFDGHLQVDTTFPGRRPDAHKPHLLAVDGDAGNVWLAVGNTLYRFDRSGALAGRFTPGPRPLIGLAVDPARSRLWAADRVALYALNSDGSQALRVGPDHRGLHGPGGFGAVRAIAFDSALDHLWVAGVRTVERYDAGGARVFEARVPGPIRAVAPDHRGGLWLATPRTLHHLDRSGAVEFSLRPFSDHPPGLGLEQAIAVTAQADDGSAWIASPKRLRHYTLTGTLLHTVLPDPGDGQRRRIHAAALPPPQAVKVTLVSPKAGALINDRMPTVRIRVDGLAVKPEQLSVTVDAAAVPVTCVDTGEVFDCALTQALAEGEHTLVAVAHNDASTPFESDPVDFTLDSVAPTITVDRPAPGFITNQADLMITGRLSESAELTINGRAVAVSSDLRFSQAVTLTEGANTFRFEAVDAAGNVGAQTRAPVLDTVPPPAPDPARISIGTPSAGAVIALGQGGSVEPGSFVTLTDLRTGESVTVQADASGAFSAPITAGPGDRIAIEVRDAAGNLSARIELAVGHLPPVFDSIPDQTVPVGQTLRVVLTAHDPQGAPLIYGVRPLPLPEHASLDSASGVFIFKPASDQVGSFSLEFSVSDGEDTVTQAVTFTVPAPDGSAPTRFRGRLLDADAAAAGGTVPVVGATVTFVGSGQTATSDAQGFFTLSNLPAGDQVLSINSATAAAGPGGAAYANFHQQQVLEPHALNQPPRSIYLPRLAAASMTTVDPNQTTVVENPALGIKLVVPPHTAKGPGGGDFAGQLSISPVPRGFSPAPLPDTLDPGLLVTIQPVGVTFISPVPISFPNIDALAPGSEVDIWSLDPNTGGFTVVGTGRVTADGQRIETVSGGVRAADWHAVLPPAAGGNGDVPAKPGPTQTPSCQDTQPSGSFVTSQTGCLSTSFALPGVVSQGQTRGLRFVYRSERADPYPLIPFDLTIPVRAAVPPTVSYRLAFGGVSESGETYVSTAGFSENKDETLRGAAGINAARLPTGVYPYRITLTSNYANSRVSSVVSGEIPLINGRDSAFGAGWGLAGLQRLHRSSKLRVMIDDGNGGYRTYFSADSGTALHFNGANSGLSFGPISLPQTHTYEVWARIQPKTSTSHIFGSMLQGFSCQQGSILRLLSTGQVWFTVDPSGCGGIGSANIISPNSIAGVWTHIAGTYDGTTAKLYINGELVGQATGKLDPGNWLSAGLDPIGQEALDGDLDELRIWSYARSADQIRADMSRSLGGTEPGLIGYWKLNEGNGLVAMDSSPERRTGSVSSAVWVASGAQIECSTAPCKFDPERGDFTSLLENSDHSFTRTLKDGTQQHFNADGLETSVVDPDGNTTTYAYDDQQRLISITDPVGQIATLAYSGDRLATVTDPAGRITRFTFDSAGDLTQVQLPDGSTRRFTYDQRHLMTAETDPRGFTVTRTYDATGRLLGATWPDGSTRAVTTAQSVGFVDPASGLGSAANPAPAVRPPAAVSTFTDGAGRVRQVVTDTFGRATRITDPAGLTTTIARDPDGNPLRIATPDGAVTTQTFDPRGNLLTVTDGVLGGTTALTYEPRFNRPTSIQNSLGQITTLGYDDKGNLTALTTPAGRSAGFTYNAQGLVASSTDPLGTVRGFEYNAAGNLSRLLEGSGGDQRVTRFSYTPEGYVHTVTDALGRVSTFDYDALGRLIRQILPDGRAIGFVYDPAGNLIAVTPPGRPAHKFDYNAVDRESAYDPPDVGLPADVTRREYNQAQQLTAIVRPDGQRIELAYDRGGRLATVTTARGSRSLGYDPGTGHLVAL